MPDSLAAMLALINDNTSGDISAADHRATIEALYEWIPPEQKYLVGRLPGETAHDDDDFFEAYSGYTEVTVSGSGTWALGRAGLGVSYTGQAVGDVVAALKPFTASGPPITIETAMSGLIRTGGSTAGAGIILTDGTTSGSNGYWTIYGHQLLHGGGGTLATMPQTSLGTGVPAGDGLLYMRVTWKSANTFTRSYSTDGDTWTDFAAADSSFTMTPTHIGFAASAWTVAGPHTARFRYLRVYEADLSV